MTEQSKNLSSLIWKAGKVLLWAILLDVAIISAVIGGLSPIHFIYEGI